MKKQGNATDIPYVRTLSNGQLEKLNRQELLNAYGVLRNGHFVARDSLESDVMALEQELDDMSELARYHRQQCDKWRDEAFAKERRVESLLDRQWYLMVPQLALLLFTALKVMSIA